MQKTTEKRRQRKDKTTSPIPEIGFLRLPQVLHILGVSKTAFYAGISSGVYPAPKKLTARTAVWSVREIREFIEKVEAQ